MKTLYKKELNYYLNNPIGYIIIILFSVFANFLFIKDIFVVGSASMKPFFSFLPWLLMIFVPALTMRIFAEENKANTIEILLTLPVSETQIVLAKFLALLTVVIISLFLTFGLPLSLSLLTKIYYPEIIVSYVGIIFVSISFISLAMFFSNLTKNQIVAFLFSSLSIFCLLVLATDFSASVLPRFLQDNLVLLTPLYNLQNFINGVLDLRSIVYFLSFTIAFLFIAVINLEKRS